MAENILFSSKTILYILEEDIAKLGTEAQLLHEFSSKGKSTPVDFYLEDTIRGYYKGQLVQHSITLTHEDSYDMPSLVDSNDDED